MSALSGPSSLFTLRASSTSIQVLSLAKISFGLAAFFAPALLSQRAFGFGRSTALGYYSGSAGVTTSTPTSTRALAVSTEGELSIAVRLFAARDIGLGLLLRDGTAATVVRALQIGAIADALDILGVGLSLLEGSISAEVASAVALVAGVSGGVTLFILNRA